VDKADAHKFQAIV